MGARKTVAERKAARVARTAGVEPTFAPGQKVEVTGSAKVDHHDPDFGHIKSDHQGAVGKVEGSYFDQERGEMRAEVRVGGEGTAESPGVLRGIPESRLKGVDATPAPAKRASFSNSGIPQARWEAAFGTRRVLNLMTDEQREAVGKA